VTGLGGGGESTGRVVTVAVEGIVGTFDMADACGFVKKEILLVYLYILFLERGKMYSSCFFIRK